MDDHEEEDDEMEESLPAYDADAELGAGADDDEEMDDDDDDDDDEDPAAVPMEHMGKGCGMRCENAAEMNWFDDDDDAAAPADGPVGDVGMEDANVDKDSISSSELDVLSDDDGWHEMSGRMALDLVREVEGMTEAQKVQCMVDVFEDDRIRTPRVLSGFYQPIPGSNDALRPIAEGAKSSFVDYPLESHPGEDRHLTDQMTKVHKAECVTRWFMKQPCPHRPNKLWEEVFDEANPCLLHLWEIEMDSVISTDKRLVGRRAAKPKKHYEAMKIGGTAYVLMRFGHGFQLTDAECQMKLREMRIPTFPLSCWGKICMANRRSKNGF